MLFRSPDTVLGAIPESTLTILHIIIANPRRKTKFWKVYTMSAVSFVLSIAQSICNVVLVLCMALGAKTDRAIQAMNPVAVTPEEAAALLKKSKRYSVATCILCPTFLGLMMVRNEHFFSIPTSTGAVSFTSFHLGLIFAVFMVAATWTLRCQRKKIA